MAAGHHALLSVLVLGGGTACSLALPFDELDRETGHPNPPRETVAYWPMDEGVGQTARDASGHGNDLLLGASAAVEASDAAWVAMPGVVCKGGALTFDGLASAATAPAGDALSALTSFSISFCFTANGPGGSGNGRILSKETSAGFGDLHVVLSDRRIGVVVYTTDGQEIGSTAVPDSIVYGTRSCWTATYDDAIDRRCRLYKDGVEVQYAQQDAANGPLRRTSSVWRIGNRFGNDRAFDGVIDEVYVDNHVVPMAVVAERAAACTP